MDVERHDGDLKWLIEHSHNAYLAWIALWLACLLGVGNILLTRILETNVLISLTHKIIVFIVYCGLVGGMIFSVFKVSTIIKHQVVWANQIEREFLRRELLSHRGLSSLIVDDNGNLCKRNRNFVVFAHVVIAAFLYLLFLLAL